MSELSAVPLAWVTGEDSPNRTASRWRVSGTDLGICWEDGHGGVLLAFGDTFHPRQTQGGGGGGDWRSNVLARSTKRGLFYGVELDWMLTDKSGHAGEILSSEKRDGVEKTVIPTGGCSVGGRQYLAYMSVRKWGKAGWWDTNHSGIAVSGDLGHSWVKHVLWPNTEAGDSQWQMLALVPHADYVYVFATQQGRLGSAYLARVPPSGLLDTSSWGYWTGQGWDRRQSHAVPVLSPPVSELSVMYHQASQQWIAAYLRVVEHAVVVQTAPQPTGPWSVPQAVATSAEYPGIYGAFLHPWSTDTAPVFLISQWGPYNVRAMRLRGLVADPPQPPGPPPVAPPVVPLSWRDRLNRWARWVGSRVAARAGRLKAQED